jgi:prepilin-type N-terminal cleavage/methylation domain-containing protein
MKKKNGFTLIELLAIIVILAIIAVITIPIILNIIDESKKGAVSDSAYGYKDAIQKFYVSRLSSNPDFEIVNGIYTIDSNGNLKYEDSSDSSKNVLYEINLNGSIPNGGFVEMHNNVLKNACIQFDELSVLITDSVVSEVKSGSCFNVSVISDEDLTIDVGTVYDFNYVSDSDNKEQVLDILQSGYYKLEVWGAQGGSSVYNSTGGYGGYSVGTVKLKKGDRLFINVGGAGVPWRC